MDEPSVTGTANLIMAAAMAIGKTTIYNAACEPYVQQLCKMLNKMGAKIEGIGSNLLHIEGVNYLEELNIACCRYDRSRVIYRLGSYDTK
jgi:UDP-N-acetylglucosamine 1-carboxyvinyltransferase